MKAWMDTKVTLEWGAKTLTGFMKKENLVGQVLLLVNLEVRTTE